MQSEAAHVCIGGLNELRGFTASLEEVALEKPLCQIWAKCGKEEPLCGSKTEEISGFELNFRKP